MSDEGNTAINRDDRVAQWLVASQSDQLSDDDILQMTEWLEASPENAKALQRASLLLLDMGAAVPEDDEAPLTQPVAVIAAPVTVAADTNRFNFMHTLKLQGRRKRPWYRRRSGMAAIVGLAAAACVCVVVFKPGAKPEPDTYQAYMTNKGENRVIPLIDGSELSLNSQTKVMVRIAPGVREITLDSGEMALKVHHDAGRPFKVLAGKTTLSDLGTQFNVLRYNGIVRVTVSEGQVQMDGGSEDDKSQNFVLKAGNEGTVNENTGVAAHRDVDAAAAFAWQQKRAIYRDKPLSDVVDDLNRYFDKPITVDGTSGKMRLTAAISLDSEDAVVHKLEAFLPVKARESDTEIRLHAQY